MANKIDVSKLKGVAVASSSGYGYASMSPGLSTGALIRARASFAAHWTHPQAGVFLVSRVLTLREVFQDAAGESGGLIEMRPEFLSGKPKLAKKRLAADDILYTLADTLSIERTLDELDGLELNDIRVALEFAAAVCGREA